MNAGLAGFLTGPVFLVFYYFLDFARAGGTDISERYVSVLCPAETIGREISPPTSYPGPLSLVQSFLVSVCSLELLSARCFQVGGDFLAA